MISVGDLSPDASEKVFVFLKPKQASTCTYVYLCMSMCMCVCVSIRLVLSNLPLEIKGFKGKALLMSVNCCDSQGGWPLLFLLSLSHLNQLYLSFFLLFSHTLCIHGCSIHPKCPTQLWLSPPPHLSCLVFQFAFSNTHSLLILDAIFLKPIKPSEERQGRNCPSICQYVIPCQPNTLNRSVNWPSQSGEILFTVLCCFKCSQQHPPQHKLVTSPYNYYSFFQPMHLIYLQVCVAHV